MCLWSFNLRSAAQLVSEQPSIYVYIYSTTYSNNCKVMLSISLTWLVQSVSNPESFRLDFFFSNSESSSFRLLPQNEQGSFDEGTRICFPLCRETESAYICRCTVYVYIYIYSHLHEMVLVTHTHTHTEWAALYVTWGDRLSIYKIKE